MRDFFEKVAALDREGQRYATATVVGRRAPVSAHLGDRAIVYADGRMEGFVGGACSREIIRRQALECIRSRRARLVSITPDAGAASTSDPEHVVVPMTCVSEGAIDVYVEPGVRPHRLVVVGMTPVAEALVRTALALDYEVVRVVDAPEQRDLDTSSAALGFRVGSLESLKRLLKEVETDTAVVVASQGHYDEEALAMVLRAGVSYAGLVASRKRGATVAQSLEEADVPGVDALRYPAGLDLGARTAPEVALSILAEIVQRRSASAGEPEAMPEHPAVPTEAATAVDPVCPMEVEVASARHRAEVDGTTYYFCCAQCRTRFLREPIQFLSAHP